MIEQILQADRLLQVDQVEHARDLYQRVVDLDPRNAIATVGLARCALADGDDQLAHELAARALEMDPENDMARRMEARLAEVLTMRGETVARPAAAAVPGAHEMRPVVTEPEPNQPSTAPPDGPAQPSTAPPDEPKQPSTAPPAEPAAASGSDSATEAPGQRQAATATPPRRSFLDRLRGR